MASAVYGNLTESPPQAFATPGEAEGALRTMSAHRFRPGTTPASAADGASAFGNESVDSRLGRGMRFTQNPLSAASAASAASAVVDYEAPIVLAASDVAADATPISASASDVADDESPFGAAPSATSAASRNSSLPSGAYKDAVRAAEGLGYDRPLRR